MTAWRAASAGWRVRIVDARRPGSGASRAAAGMLAPIAEAAENADEGAVAFGRESLALWPGVVSALETATRLNLSARFDGAVMVADHPDAPVFQRAYAFSAHAGVAIAPVTDPALSAKAALRVGEEGAVDPRAVIAAVSRALNAHGVRVETRRVAALEPGPAARFDDGDLAKADRIIIAAGWAAETLAPGAMSADLVPVKGQMLCLRAPAGLELGVVRSQEVYLVSRPGGRVFAGATVEPGASDDATDADALARLAEAAWSLAPALRGAPVLERWAGVRPGRRRGRGPIIEETAPGVLFACGHHRNGVLLAPATAKRALHWLGVREGLLTTV